MAVQTGIDIKIVSLPSYQFQWAQWQEQSNRYLLNLTTEFENLNLYSDKFESKYMV